MKEQFEHFVQTDLFVSLPAETVFLLLRSDDISVESEEQVIGAIARWVDAGGAADDEKLRVHAPEMLKEVQWQLTSVQYRSRLLDSYPTLRKCPECLESPFTPPDYDFDEGPKIESVSFDEATVRKELMTLNESKSPGPDDIPPKLLKELAVELAKPLSMLFQASFEAGGLPADWKSARITPLHKGGSKASANNYRPISLTSICCKLMEKIIKRELMRFLEQHNLLSDAQQGFRSGRSCVTNLLNCLERWTRLDVDSLPATWDFARTLNVEVLAEKCIGLMKEQFEHFIQTDLFVSLPAETVLTLLRSDGISVESEEQVIAAISRWVGAGGAADDEKLRVHAPAMLKEVQWQLTSVQCRSRLLDSYPTLRKSSECLCLMLQVEQWIGAAEKDKPPRPFNIRPRLSQTFFVFGKDKGQDRYSVLRVDAHLRRAERVADMKGPRSHASYSVVGESIFVVGGCNPGRADVDEFLVGEGRWRKRTPLTFARWEHAAAVTKVPAIAAAAEEKTLIGVFGGWGGDARLSSCELYDVSQDRWHKSPDLPEKRSSSAAACLPGDSRVFVFGGYDDSYSPLASVVFCHLRADWQGQGTPTEFWQPAAPMRIARRALAATPFRGAILVAGGHDGQMNLNVVEMFSLPDTCKPLGQWTELAGMKQPRRYFTLLTSAKALFALGNDDAPKNTVETLTAPGGSTDSDNDLASWVWSSMNPVETLEWIVGAASIRM
nr:unnamed protein product [Spirometra erinaceieuropaei]